MKAGLSRFLTPLAFAALAVFAGVVAIELAQPFRGPAMAFDSQVSTFHFELLVSGRPLEQFISTTPKPLLTLVYGPLHALGGWTAISLATIGAFVAGVVLVAALAGRLVGPVAAAFAGVATAMSATLLFDVGFALATPWALPLWAAAGLAATDERPRYRLAGAFLALATLARVETVVLTGGVLVALVVAAAWSRRSGQAGPPTEAWLGLAIALGALPIMLAHDLIVTGDPLYWTKVAAFYSENTRQEVLRPRQVLQLVVDHWSGLIGPSLLAVVGTIRVAVERRWAILVGLGALGPLILAALMAMAARRIFVDARYLAAPELATYFAAALGVGYLLRRAAGSPGAHVAVAAGVALVLVGPYWIRQPDLRPTIERNVAQAADLDRALPLIAAALDRMPPLPPASLARLIVPVSLRFRVIVDLGLRQPEVVGQQVNRFQLGSGFPVAGQIVLHHRLEASEPTDPDLAEIQTSVPKVVHGILVEPILADPVSGVWVVRLTVAPPT